MKRILVPTDLSDIAERGLQLAVDIAKRANAEVYLINFTKHPFGKTFSAMGEISPKVDSEESMFNIELLRSTRSKLSLLGLHYSQQGVTINTEIVDDKLSNGIDVYLKQHQIDLVVMGTSGEENIKEQFVGNRTERVIEISSCPVISVRDGYNVDSLSHIVLAIDVIKETNVYPAIQSLKELADYFNSTIHFVHVADPAISMEKNLKEYFTTIALRFLIKRFDVTILHADNEPEAVMDFAGKMGAGLIAVLKNSSQGIFRIFSDHFSDKMVKEVGRPVFTYNLQNV